MTLFLSKYEFIWPNKNDWAKAYNYCAKKHYQQKQELEMVAPWFVEAL